MMGYQHDKERSPKRGLRIALWTGALVLFALFAGLGTWQVERLQWKLDLIERVETRVHAAPVAPPAPSRWGQMLAQSDEYRPVRLAGHYLYEYTTPVQAVSELGSGWWLLTPFCTSEGYIVLVNRGFVQLERGGPGRYPAHRAQAGSPVCASRIGSAPAAADASGDGGQIVVTGLLRMTEQHGGVLRGNDPEHNRWYSRDVQAIAMARGLYNVAPYFVDAAKNQEPADAPDHPAGGLTVITFRNNHLAYAITWYALALMVAGVCWWAARGGANPGQDDVSRK
jgi:surfeit locus 1 family protein